MPVILLHTKPPVSVLGFNSTVALLSQGHETPAPPGVSSCICEELLGSAWVLTTDLCFLFISGSSCSVSAFLSSTPLPSRSLHKKQVFPFFTQLFARHWIFMAFSCYPTSTHTIVDWGASFHSLSYLCDFTFHFFFQHFHIVLTFPTWMQCQLVS